MDAYAENLFATKQHYPFDQLRQFWIDPDDRADCDALQKAFDQLVARFIEVGPTAPEAKKVTCFKKAIEKTNEQANVIETGEREKLGELTNRITVACGLNPADYGDGEGLASEWRER